MKALRLIYFTILIVFILTAAGCTNNTKESKKTEQDQKTAVLPKFDVTAAKSIKVNRIYGIGYPGNDNALYVAADNGLKIYKEANWLETTTNRHQYMGFQAVEDGFISSGHPQKGTGLKNPLGLVKSDNKGETLKKLAFYGKGNYIFMASSYSGKGLYVISDQETDKLNTGVNYSKDNGQTWQPSKFKDFQADSLGMMAVHPVNGDIMAMSTRSGIYYSTDNGNTMKLMTEPFMVTALTFAGDSLLFCSVENDKILLKTLNPATAEQTNIAIPFLDYDNPITYLAVNPKNPNQMAFTTYKNDLYESTDGGKTWNNLFLKGEKEQE